MPKYWSAALQDKTAGYISKEYGVSSEYAENLSKAILNGLSSHGYDPEDTQDGWETVIKTIPALVPEWIEKGLFK